MALGMGAYGVLYGYVIMPLLCVGALFPLSRSLVVLVNAVCCGSFWLPGGMDCLAHGTFFWCASDPWV